MIASTPSVFWMPAVSTSSPKPNAPTMAPALPARRGHAHVIARTWHQTRATVALQGERTKGLADQAGSVRAAGWRAPPRRCMQRKAVPLTR